MKVTPESPIPLSAACALEPGSAAPTPAASPALKKSRRDLPLSSFIHSSFYEQSAHRNRTPRSRSLRNSSVDPIVVESASMSIIADRAVLLRLRAKIPLEELLDPRPEVDIRLE